MTLTLKLPNADGTTSDYRLTGEPIGTPATMPVFNRIAYAAAHVVSDPLRDVQPWGAPAIDWDATMAFRHHLWSLGFKIAEAMDTAQRGMGLDWAGARELIRRSLASRAPLRAQISPAVQALTSWHRTTPSIFKTSLTPMRRRSVSSRPRADGR